MNLWVTTLLHKTLLIRGNLDVWAIEEQHLAESESLNTFLFH